MSEVRLARASEIGDLAGVLARAFARDPYFSYLAGDAPERNQRMRDGWSGLLRFASDHLSATYTTDDHAGVALWHPPGYDGPGFVEGLRLLGPMRTLAGGLRRLRHIGAVVASLEKRRRHHAGQAHWYLSALGVDTERQGEGIGTALLGPVLARADADGTAAYLETATGRNVLLYERLGFDVVEELTLARTDIHGWLMLRPARG